MLQLLANYLYYSHDLICVIDKKSNSSAFYRNFSSPKAIIPSPNHPGLLLATSKTQLVHLTAGIGCIYQLIKRRC